MKYIFLLLLISITLFADDVRKSNSEEVNTLDIDKVKSSESKKAMNKWLEGKFGLQPYRVNYLLPYGYTDTNYKSYVPSDEYKNVEAELQVSLKLNVANNLLGLNESYYLSYTHTAFWQVYANSSPFRETNYNPEGFVIFPLYDDDSILKLRSIKFALAHKSNGQGNTSNVVYANPSQNPGNRSRSINYVYSTVRFQHDTLLADLTLMYPFPESEESNDNPDIMDYLGYTKLKLSYFLDKHMFTLMGRGNFMTNKGAVEGTYSYPLIDDTYLYIKVFSGYGESLIDYNNKVTKYSIGFSFSR